MLKSMCTWNVHSLGWDFTELKQHSLDAQTPTCPGRHGATPHHTKPQPLSLQQTPEIMQTPGETAQQESSFPPPCPNTPCRGSDSTELTCTAGDPGSIPGAGRSPWRKAWQPTPVFLPGESHGQRSLVGYSPWGCKESDTTEWLSLSLFTLK